MGISEVKRIVKEINYYIQKQLWLDFEVKQYTKDMLTIIGSIHFSSTHNIEIYFKNIFFISLPIEWKINTSVNVLKLLDGKLAITENRKFQVEQGYQIFSFKFTEFFEFKE